MKLKKLSAENFCCFPKFELPLENQGLVLITGENKDTAAAENNGSGKSTIFKALTWGLYGKTIDGERGDKIILDGETKATVEVNLQDSSGEVWSVIRTRTKGTTKLSLFKGKSEEFMASKDDVQNKVVEMLGLDYNGFRNTVLYGQNDSSRFADPRTRDSDRKKVLRDILKTSILEECHKFAIDERKKKALEISQMENELYKIGVQIENVPLLLEKEREETFEENTKGSISRLKDDALYFKKSAIENLELSKRVDDEINTDEEITKYQIKVDALNRKIDKADSVKSKMVNLIDTLTYERDEVKTGLVEKLIDIKSKSDAITSRLEELSVDNCPVCNTDLNGEDVTQFKKAFLNKRKEIRTEGKSISSKLKEQNLKIDEIEGKINKLERILDEKDELVKEERATFSKLSELLDEKNKRSSESKDFQETAKSFVESAKKIVSSIKELKKKENPFTKGRIEAEEKINKLNSDGHDLHLKIEAEKIELQYFHFWEQGFGNRGLPSFILDSAMPFLAKRANTYLRILSDGDIKMDFTTQRELKSRNEAKDEIEITWEIEGAIDYPPSGGQLKKMELATDFALMDLVATREGGHADILALDEILDGLDAEGSRRVVLLLKKLSKYRSSIFVISHLPEVSESFERSMRVTKQGGGSTLERVI